MSLVLRAKGSFHTGAEVAEVVATTSFSLIMKEKEDEYAECFGTLRYLEDKVLFCRHL